MAIVKEVVHGACKTHIYDDYIRKDPDEVQKILDRIELIAWRVMMEKQTKTKPEASV